MGSNIATFPLNRDGQIISVGGSFHYDGTRAPFFLLQSVKRIDDWVWFTGDYSKTSTFTNISKYNVRIYTESYETDPARQGLRQTIDTWHEVKADFVNVPPGHFAWLIQSVNPIKFPTYTDKQMGWTALVYPLESSEYAGWIPTNQWIPLSNRITANKSSIETNKTQTNETIEDLQTSITNLENKSSGVTEDELKAEATRINNELLKLDEKIVAASDVSKNELKTEVDKINASITKLQESVGTSNPPGVSNYTDIVAGTNSVTPGEYKLDNNQTVNLDTGTDNIYPKEWYFLVEDDDLNATATVTFNDLSVDRPAKSLDNNQWFIDTNTRNLINKNEVIKFTLKESIQSDIEDAKIKLNNNALNFTNHYEIKRTWSKTITEESVIVSGEFTITRGDVFPVELTSHLHQLIGHATIPDGLYMRDRKGDWIIG